MNKEPIIQALAALHYISKLRPRKCMLAEVVRAREAIPPLEALLTELESEATAIGPGEATPDPQAVRQDSVVATESTASTPRAPNISEETKLLTSALEQAVFALRGQVVVLETASRIMFDSAASGSPLESCHSAITQAESALSVVCGSRSVDSSANPSSVP